MVLIYQTAHLPVIFKAKYLSFAAIFHFICTFLKYLLPILACYFYISYASGTTIDNELPSVIPGDILSYFSRVINNEDINTTDIIQYPPTVSNYSPTEIVSISSTPRYYKSKLDTWKISARISYEPNVYCRASQTVYVHLLFNFTVKLRKFATNTISAIGSFTKSFPVGVNYISATGDLKLEQNEIINFRGSFNNTNLEDKTLDDYTSFAEIQQAHEELDTFFYVDWEEPIIRVGKWIDFQLDLNINIKEVAIAHSIPLISSLESCIVLYLSALLFTKIILDYLQGFLFRYGIIKTWICPLYQPVESSVNAKFTHYH